MDRFVMWIIAATYLIVLIGIAWKFSDITAVMIIKASYAIEKGDMYVPQSSYLQGRSV